MKLKRPSDPTRHALIFTFLGVTLFVASAVVAGLVTKDTVLLKSITAFAPVVFFIWYRTRFQMPDVISYPLAISRRLLWPCPFLFLLVTVYGTHVPKWPDVAMVSSVVVYCLLVGLSEELTFRGVIFHAFRRLEPAWYLVISSTLFGVLHYEQGLSGIGITLIVGLAFGLARVAGVPLYALILCHAVIDIPGALSAYTTRAYPVMALGALIYTAVVALLFLTRAKHWSQPFFSLEATKSVIRE